MMLVDGAALVCYPYEFTLLSNILPNQLAVLVVCYPYEFTLLSNYYTYLT